MIWVVPSIGIRMISQTERARLTSMNGVTNSLSNLLTPCSSKVYPKAAPESNFLFRFDLVSILVPEVSVRLLPALIDTFLPSILMSPLGAEMVMPVKASRFTVPSEELILTLRLSDDMSME